MKKLLILTCLATLLLGGIYLANANNFSNLTNGKETLKSDNIKQKGKKGIVSILSGTDTNNTTGSNNFTGTNHNTANGLICDFNDDGENNIADINRFYEYCNITNGGTSIKCDLNNDGEFNIADINLFNYTCYNTITGTGSNVEEPIQEGEMCDLNNDGENNIADINRFYEYCSITNGGTSKKCDLNNDGEFTIADLNLFNYNCISGIEGVNTENGRNNNEMDLVSTNTNGFTNEQIKAYEFAYKNGITTVSIEKSKPNSPLTRIEMAKMLSYYAINVLGKEPDTSKGIPLFNDVPASLNKQYDNAVTLSYQLGIMGQNMKNNNFRRNDTVTRAEFATALSRMLYGIKDGEGKKYYEPHIEKLHEEGILNKTDPKMKENRGYVMTMLMRTVTLH